MPRAAQRTGAARALSRVDGVFMPDEVPVDPESADSLVDAYARYYATGYYDQRYPRPNARSLGVILDVAREARTILDFGCGDGRYAVPLLRRTEANILAYDICPRALADLERRLGHERSRRRVRTVLGPTKGRFSLEPIDLAIMMFGVLGHISCRDRRLAALRQVRENLAFDGKLVVSVPNARRRFAKEQQHHNVLIAAGTAKAPALEQGDIVYSRTHGGETISLYYHLYTPETLLADLAEAGFGTVDLMAESVLPETVVTRSRLGRFADDVLHAVTPMSLGYGFLAVAER